MKPREIDKILAKESAELLDDLVAGEPGARERLDAFLGESRRHVQHFLTMVALDQELKHLDRERKWDIGPAQGEENKNVVPLAEDTEQSPTSSSRSRWAPWGLLAAGVAGILLTGIAWLITGYSVGWKDYATATGEQRAIELADGSVVHLNTASHLQAHITDTARDIRLLSGEALFKVHHDTSRPFRVDAGNIVVQAVGTQFNVHRLPQGGATVAVVEGRVLVESEQQSGAAEPADVPSPTARAPRAHVTNLTVGQRAQIQSNGEVATERISDLSSVTDWQRRRLPFEQTPLGKIVEEFNRYNRAPRIVVQGEAAERLFSGIFDADEPERFIKLIEREPGLQVERNGDVVLIRAAGARPASVIADSAKQE